MHPVRQKILEILKRNHQATVVELAEALDMAPVSVRHHLDLLIGDNLVCTPRVRRGAGAGRPKQMYALTPDAASYFPNNYRQLAKDSLSALKQLMPEEQVLGVMRSLAARTASKAPSNLETMPPSERIQAVTTFLSGQGFMADFEVQGNEVFLHTCNCPYALLADAHPELCHMDLQLIYDLTGMDPQRIAHIAEGDSRCTYRLTAKEDMALHDIPLMIAVPTGSLSNA